MRARNIFYSILIPLIFVVLPTEVLFRLSSWTLYMPWSDIFREIGMMTVLITILTTVASLLISGAMRLFDSGNITEKAEKRVLDGITATMFAMTALYAAKMLRNWIRAIAGVVIHLGKGPKMLLLLGGLTFFGLFAWKYVWLGEGSTVRSSLLKLRGPALLLIFAAAIAVASNGVTLHDYHGLKSNAARLARPGLPNVVLISFDSLAARDMSLYGYHLRTTPRLDAFARESYVFDNFFAASNWTLPAVASMISGIYPSTSGVHHTESYFLARDRRKNLAQALLNEGYRTVAVVSNDNAHPLTLRISDSFSATTEPPVIHRIQLDRLLIDLYRMKDYRTYWWVQDLLSESLGINFQFSEDSESTYWPPSMVFDRMLALFASGETTFIWGHVLPPHNPYLPDPPFKYSFGRFKDFSRLKDFPIRFREFSNSEQAEMDQLRSRYDEFILETDSEVGEFLDKLKASGRMDDSIVIITADHGESFSKNYFGHGGPYVWDQLIHIPLIIHLPGQKNGSRVPFFAGQVDLLPTLMDLLGLPIPSWAEGESLKPSMLYEKPTLLPKLSMNLDLASRFTSPRQGTVAVMEEGWKFVTYLGTGKEELYNLAEDPLESVNLIRDKTEVAEKLRRRIKP